MDALRWSRVIGDTVFTIGALGFVAAVATLTIGRRRRGDLAESADADAGLPKARTSRR